MARIAFVRVGMALLLIALVAAGPAGMAGAQQKGSVVRFGVVGTTSTMYYAPLVVAEQKGFFTQEGVQLEQTVIGPDDNLVRAVAGGALDMGIPEISIAVNGAAHGAPVKVIASLTDRYPYALFGTKGIASYADLRGKTISHWTVAPQVSVALIRRLLEAHGLKEGDYNLIAGGNLAARYAALSQGGVGAAILTAPFDLLARKNGFVDLGGLYDIPAVFAGVITNTTWAARHHDSVVAALKALILGFRYASNPTNKTEVVKMIADIGKTDPAVVGQTYDQFYRDQTYLTSWDLVPSPRSILGVMDILGSLGQISKSADPLAYFQLSYLNDAVRGLSR